MGRNKLYRQKEKDDKNEEIKKKSNRIIMRGSKRHLPAIYGCVILDSDKMLTSEEFLKYSEIQRVPLYIPEINIKTHKIHMRKKKEYPNIQPVHNSLHDFLISEDYAQPANVAYFDYCSRIYTRKNFATGPKDDFHAFMHRNIYDELIVAFNFSIRADTSRSYSRAKMINDINKYIPRWAAEHEFDALYLKSRDEHVGEYNSGGGRYFCIYKLNKYN